MLNMQFKAEDASSKLFTTKPATPGPMQNEKSALLPLAAGREHTLHSQEENV
jgi:hypothetical protein